MSQTPSDAELVQRLRERDETAFKTLVERYHGAMVRMALGYVREAAAAEDAAQEAWLGVLRGIDAFRGESSVRTWLFRILINRAITRAKRDARSAGGRLDEAEDGARTVADSRFDAAPPHHWRTPPRHPGPDPEEQLSRRELLEVVEAAVAKLPPTQRDVVTLRDIEGWSAQEVCNVLEISETNQRVMLHRGRARIRAALEQYLDPGTEGRP